jgi:hypothetical protein
MVYEHEQNRAIISNFDKTLATCALKHEILEYSKELR